MKKLKAAAAVLLAAVMIMAVSVTAFAKTQTPFDNSEFFEYGDYSVHYRVFEAKGDFRGRIMMLHGFGCSTYSWEPMAKLMSENGYECVLADLPGFGYTTRETADVRHVDREELIEKLMLSIAPMDEWILAGHSMGGGVAMNIACETPGLKALMLYCPAPVSKTPSFMESMMNNAFMGKFMSAFLKYGTKVTPLMRVVLLAAFVDWDFSMNYDVSAVADPLAIDYTGESMISMMFNARPTDLEAVSKIDMPVLLVQAQYDLVLMPWMKIQVNSALADAETYEVKKGGHMCNENRADELAGVTLGFLGSNGL
ncbi:MAG: alpha/beta hydrolase [Oscillospiraceae bacterium]|nr:alpha/beta hydrolase [Oscillospiraceae bacterium]